MGHGDCIGFGNGDSKWDGNIAASGGREEAKFGEQVALKMGMGLVLELALRIMWGLGSSWKQAVK